MGLRAVTLGHGYPVVTDAARGRRALALRTAVAPRTEGGRTVSRSGADFRDGQFTKDGSTAVTAALKLSRASSAHTREDVEKPSTRPSPCSGMLWTEAWSRSWRTARQFGYRRNNARRPLEGPYPERQEDISPHRASRPSDARCYPTERRTSGCLDMPACLVY